jgi:hypothetical protein
VSSQVCSLSPPANRRSSTTRWPLAHTPSVTSNRHPHALFADPHARIPTVQKQVTNLELAEIAFGSGLEVFARAHNQAPHRILR